ncbi:MAG TPA: sigma-70 family RNA polymerase sigma factor [Candidatus Eisenbacteria bacterium]|jgi:RNA polymerase sigma-70 factor (ECF subfamily)
MPSFSADDRVLAEALMLRGDEQAFRTLYRRHTPTLYQMALRLLGGSEADAEDVVQDAWIRATTRLSTFRWESSFRTWLVGIGLNRAREVLRRRGRRRTIDLAQADGHGVPPSRDGDRVDLERAIAELPDGSRAVLVLHDIEGFTHEEIGRRLKIAVGTSKSQLFAARRALRARLEPRQEIPDVR